MVLSRAQLESLDFLAGTVPESLASISLEFAGFRPDRTSFERSTLSGSLLRMRSKARTSSSKSVSSALEYTQAAA